MKITYEVKTTPSPDGRLIQTVDHVSPDGSRQSIACQIINLQELQTRQALISLGWTPPKEGRNP